MQDNRTMEKELLIEIIKLSLRPSGNIHFPDGLDILELAKIIKRQHIELLVYPGLSKQSDEKCLELAKLLESRYHNLLFKSVVQENEIENLLQCMEKEKIETLPLKGWIMRRYYPDPSMRIMTDFDILIRDFNEQKMKKFMEDRGFEIKSIGISNHDVYVKKDILIVELHKSLSNVKLESQKPKLHQWLNEVWTRCKKVSEKGFIHELTKEDFYIYHLIHYYKHIWSSGAGIRSLVDVYMILKADEQNLDWNYVDCVLNELELKPFEVFIRNLAMTAFGEREVELNTVQKEFLDMILSGGLFGSKKLNENMRLVGKEKESYGTAKLAVLRDMVFPPVRMLQVRYPVLKKYPWMLPAVWICRGCRIAVHESWKISKFFKGSNRESYDEIYDIFQNAGIKW